jgi:hypothetical protein
MDFSCLPKLGRTAAQYVTCSATAARKGLLRDGLQLWKKVMNMQESGERGNEESKEEVRNGTKGN